MNRFWYPHRTNTRWIVERQHAVSNEVFYYLESLVGTKRYVEPAAQLTLRENYTKLLQEQSLKKLKFKRSSEISKDYPKTQKAGHKLARMVFAQNVLSWTEQWKSFLVMKKLNLSLIDFRELIIEECSLSCKLEK